MEESVDNGVNGAFRKRGKDLGIDALGSWKERFRDFRQLKRQLEDEILRTHCKVEQAIQILRFKPPEDIGDRLTLISQTQDRYEDLVSAHAKLQKDMKETYEIGKSKYNQVAKLGRIRDSRHIFRDLLELPLASRHRRRQLLNKNRPRASPNPDSGAPDSQKGASTSTDTAPSHLQQLSNRQSPSTAALPLPLKAPTTTTQSAKVEEPTAASQQTPDPINASGWKLPPRPLPPSQMLSISAQQSAAAARTAANTTLVMKDSRRTSPLRSTEQSTGGSASASGTGSQADETTADDDLDGDPRDALFEVTDEYRLALDENIRMERECRLVDKKFTLASDHFNQFVEINEKLLHLCIEYPFIVTDHPDPSRPSDEELEKILNDDEFLSDLDDEDDDDLDFDTRSISSSASSLDLNSPKTPMSEGGRFPLIHSGSANSVGSMAELDWLNAQPRARKSKSAASGQTSRDQYSLSGGLPWTEIPHIDIPNSLIQQILQFVSRPNCFMVYTLDGGARQRAYCTLNAPARLLTCQPMKTDKSGNPQLDKKTNAPFLLPGVGMSLDTIRLFRVQRSAHPDLAKFSVFFRFSNLRTATSTVAGDAIVVTASDSVVLTGMKSTQLNPPQSEMHTIAIGTDDERDFHAWLLSLYALLDVPPIIERLSRQLPSFEEVQDLDLDEFTLCVVDDIVPATYIAMKSFFEQLRQSDPSVCFCSEIEYAVLEYYRKHFRVGVLELIHILNCLASRDIVVVTPSPSKVAKF